MGSSLYFTEFPIWYICETYQGKLSSRRYCNWEKWLKQQNFWAQVKLWLLQILVWKTWYSATARHSETKNFIIIIFLIFFTIYYIQGVYLWLHTLRQDHIVKTIAIYYGASLHCITQLDVRSSNGFIWFAAVSIIPN